MKTFAKVYRLSATTLGYDNNNSNCVRVSFNLTEIQSRKMECPTFGYPIFVEMEDGCLYQVMTLQKVPQV